ncbi:MAG: hypothetical protein IPO81_19815 [Kouleothrix sp.]|nr:hypothetical protein [Kouleothrix sp.]
MLQTFRRSNAQTFKRSTLTLSRAAWLALIFALALPPLWLSLAAAPRLRIDVGEWGDQAFLDGVFRPETTSSELFRWTQDHTELVVPNLSGRYRLLRLHAHGWRPPGVDPPRVQIDLAGKPVATIRMTRDLLTYQIALPRDGGAGPPSIRIGFTSQTYSSAADDREVGFALDWIELDQTEPISGPSIWQLGGQALLLGLALALVGALALPLRSTVWSGLLLAAALVGANFWQPLWVALALESWTIIVAALLAATWLAAPWVKRALAPWMTPHLASVAWGLFVAALALRLFGAVHPLFDSHDLPFHRVWQESILSGQLYIFSTPSEFQNRPTFNPPVGYVLMLPLYLLLPSTRLVVQVGPALVDGLGCLVLLPLARELGLSARAGLLALALYLALPINATILWWGFVTNDMAQTAGLLLLWALLRLARRPDRTRLAAFTGICVIALLMHVGALVLIAALLAACVVLGWRRLTPTGRGLLVAGIALAGLITIPIYFTAVADTLFSRAQRAGPSLSASIANSVALRDIRLDHIGSGLQRGLLPPVVMLAPLGLAQLLRGRQRHPLGRTLVVGWVLVCLAFFGVYMGLGLLVRYIYFAAPLVCLALGVLLDGLWRRRGRIVVLALIVFVVGSGAAMWLGGVLMRIKPSLLPLTQ